VLHSLQHALAAVALGIAVAQFDGFTHTGGGTGGNCRASRNAAFEEHFGFHGRVTARIENFAANDVNDGAHCFFLKKERIVKDPASRLAG